jgi:hypothetical protein
VAGDDAQILRLAMHGGRHLQATCAWLMPWNP